MTVQIGTVLVLTILKWWIDNGGDERVENKDETETLEIVLILLITLFPRRCRRDQSVIDDFRRDKQ